MQVFLDLWMSISHYDVRRQAFDSVASFMQLSATWVTHYDEQDLFVWFFCSRIGIVHERNSEKQSRGNTIKIQFWIAPISS